VVKGFPPWIRTKGLRSDPATPKDVTKCLKGYNEPIQTSNHHFQKNNAKLEGGIRARSGLRTQHKSEILTP